MTDAQLTAFVSFLWGFPVVLLAWAIIWGAGERKRRQDRQRRLDLALMRIEREREHIRKLEF